MRVPNISTNRIQDNEWLDRLAKSLDPNVISIDRARRMQLSMSPAGRTLVPESQVPKGARESAVCIVLSGESPQLEIPLIIREKNDGPHSGQVAIPGGGRETADKTIEETALRECEEEIGLPRSSVFVLGTLYPLYLHVSNYRVVPVIVRTTDHAFWSELRPQPGEVAGILRAELPAMYASQATCTVSYHGGTHVVPSYFVDGTAVWGATAMILAELRDTLVSCGAFESTTVRREK